MSAYVRLRYDTDMENAELRKRQVSIKQKTSKICGDYLVFFDLELADLPQERLEVQYDGSENLRKYKSYIDNVRKTRPHNLSQDVERALTVRAPYVGKTPVVDFYDKELSLLRFKLDDSEKEMNLERLLNLLTNSKDSEKRASAMQELNRGLEKMVRAAALSLNVVAGAWEIENKERGYKNLRSRRNLSNNVPDDVVNSLLQGARVKGVELAKRYYGLKKSILKATQGLETLRWSDRNAPIDVGGTEDTYTWEQAVSLVQKGYSKFSPYMAELFMNQVDQHRIDVPAVNGKAGGAYCHGVVPGIGPFQLLNFNGSKHDVATLAHESGHGCHFILSSCQGHLQSHPPLTLAETASIFGEMIVFRDLLDSAPSPAERLAMLMSKIDDIINSVVRQCSFDRFEELVHTSRKEGEVSHEDICKYWMQAVVQYYGEEGEVFDSYENISHLWAYVTHFHHVPFYVYSYAFADLVVGSLYGAYLKSSEGFEEKLLELLKAGGTQDFVTALSPFGLKPDDPAFWADALEAHLGGLMDEAEKLAKELGYA
eukprot:scaffold3068_cov401-Prasinococcus_capsulatus_cf.AAC.49